jgi:predicted ABC-type ATPase
MPVLHVIAGPNGAGKSAFYEYLLQARFPAFAWVNAQEYAAGHLAGMTDVTQCTLLAQRWADEERERLLQQRVSFITETVMSHPSRLALLSQAKALGYEVVLHALALDEPRQLLQRVAQRVREGGPPVPAHKVLARYPRSLENIRGAVTLADLSFLIDSAPPQAGGPRLVASYAGGRPRLHVLRRPRWVERVMGIAEN